MKKRIFITENELIDLIENYILEYNLIDEARGRKPLYEKGLHNLFKVTFPDDSTFYSKSIQPTVKRYLSNVISLAKGGVKSNFLDTIRKFKYEVKDVDLVFSSKNEQEVGNKKSELFNNDINSLNLNKSGVKEKYSVNELPINKKYIIKSTNGNLFVSSNLVFSDDKVKNRVDMNDSLNRFGTTYYKIKNPNKIKVFGSESPSLIKKEPKKAGDVEIDVTDELINRYLKNNPKYKEIMGKSALDVDVDFSKNIEDTGKPLSDIDVDFSKNEKRYKKINDLKDIPTVITPESVLNFVISKGYKTTEEWRKDKVGGGAYLYNKAALNGFIKDISKFLERKKGSGIPKKVKTTFKIPDKLPTKTKPSRDYYDTSTSTNPNISFNYKLKESIYRALRTLK